MNEEIIKSYSIFAHMGFKCVSKDGEDLTEEVKEIYNISYDGCDKK